MRLATIDELVFLSDMSHAEEIEFPPLFDLLRGTFVRHRYSGSLSHASQVLSLISDDIGLRHALLHAYSGDLNQAWNILNELATSSSVWLRIRASKYVDLLQRGSVFTVPFDMALDAPKLPTMLCQVDLDSIPIDDTYPQEQQHALSDQELAMFF